MPRSEATCLRVSPLVNAMCTASRRNSSLRLGTMIVSLMAIIPFKDEELNCGKSRTIAARFSARFPDRVTCVRMLAPFVDKLVRKSLALLRKPILGDVPIRLASLQKLMDQSAGFMDFRHWAAFRDRLLKVWNTSGAESSNSCEPARGCA